MDDDILLRARDLLGFDEDGDVERIAEVVAQLVGEAVSAPLAKSIVAELAPVHARAVASASEHDVRRDARAMVEALAERTGIPVGRAREAIVVVLGLFASALDVETRRRLRQEVPATVAELFDEHPLGEVGNLARPAPAGHTLATGKPGSSHPVSVRPEPERDPHAHRLAVAHGTRQEENGDTLARARPGSRR